MESVHVKHRNRFLFSSVYTRIKNTLIIKLHSVLSQHDNAEITNHLRRWLLASTSTAEGSEINTATPPGKQQHGKSSGVNKATLNPESKHSSNKRTAADETPGWRLTQRVDHADSTDVQLQQGVVDGLPALVVHEQVVDHGAQLRRQAGQEVHHAQPGDADLRPGDVEREQHQEANQRDAWKKRNTL